MCETGGEVWGARMRDSGTVGSKSNTERTTSIGPGQTGQLQLNPFTSALSGSLRWILFDACSVH
jgi:hypothetical protein